MTNQLIIRSDSSLTVTISPAAQASKAAALALAATIERVSSASENGMAVAAQTRLVELKRLVEADRKLAKAPVIEYGRKIDATASEFVSEVEAALTRVSSLLGDFMALEKAKERAAEQLRIAELDKLGKEKLVEIAKAESVDEIEAVREHYAELAAKDSEPPQLLRAEGQRARDDWEIEVTNPFDLARYQPACVKITPLLGEIKKLLNEGIAVRGVKAKPIVKSQVRLSKAVDVEDWTVESHL